jgi:hypothetical protein
MQRIRLDHHSFQIQPAQQLFEGGSLAALVGVVSLLCHSNSQGAGIDRDLGNKTMVALLGLNR